MMMNVDDDDDNQHDQHDNESSDINNNNMSWKAKAPAKKVRKPAGLKTTGETIISPLPKAQAAPIRSYNINMMDGWSCVHYSNGPLDYFFVEFHINGVLLEDGYKRAIHKECYGKHHLAAFINDYSDSHSLVTAVDQMLI
jgi:hypothetical protein